jgi:hypothetical protein
MTRKILLQNKTFFIIITVAIIFFGFILYLGGKRIYDRESKWRHGIGSDQLVSGKMVLKSFFLNFEHHLSFLRDFPATKEYVNSHFKSKKFRNEVENLFYSLSKVSKAIYQIRIIDSRGQEINCGNPSQPHWVEGQFAKADIPVCNVTCYFFGFNRWYQLLQYIAVPREKQSTTSANFFSG